jgi:hypothetical protein
MSPRRTPHGIRRTSICASPRTPLLGSRRGDIFFLQEFVAIFILVFVAILIFGLFWFSSWQFRSKVEKSTTVTESFAVTKGGVILRSYLSTRLDEPVEKFLPAGVSDVAVESQDLTFAEAIRRIRNDPACVAALSKHGASYKPITNLSKRAEFLQVFAETEIPDGLCRSFFLRTVLFYRAISPYDGFLLTVGAPKQYVIGAGKPLKLGWSFAGWAGMAPLIIPGTTLPAVAQGIQDIPGEPPTNLQLVVYTGGLS